MKIWMVASPEILHLVKATDDENGRDQGEENGDEEWILERLNL